MIRRTMGLAAAMQRGKERKAREGEIGERLTKKREEDSIYFVVLTSEELVLTHRNLRSRELGCLRRIPKSF